VPSYQTPARALYNRLGSSSALLSIAVGGVWDRPIERLGPQATPEAFASTPPHRQLPAISIPDNGEEFDPLGPSTAFYSFPQVWFYADDDPNGLGRQALELAVARARLDLHGWEFDLTTGTSVQVRIIGRFGVRTDPTDDNRLIDYLRLQADGLWTGDI
jgi:hypothetical protein